MQTPRRERGFHRPTDGELRELGMDPTLFAAPAGVSINSDWREIGPAYIGIDFSACQPPSAGQQTP
jgi:hypothetical protein